MDGSATPRVVQPLTAQRKKAYSSLSEFSLALIQAMLRTGYYASEHPEAQKSLDGLYDQFHALMEERAELSYIIVERRESQEIAVEGYAEVPLSLYEMMVRGMADLFTPKFLDFFKRWSLLSVSIKAETSKEEFDKFVELMSQPPAAGTGQTASERLTQAFVDHNILRISTVFKHEMVGRERHLPWRVRLALSRLRRDLRVLPLYKKATPEQLTHIKLQIIDDVIRPVRTAALLKDFLVNYDLIAADISVLEEADVENEICQNLSDVLLVSTAQEILNEIEKLAEYKGDSFPWGEKVSTVRERHVSSLRDLAITLCGRGSAMEHDFIEALVAQKILRADELPPELRRMIENRNMADAFIAKQDKYLEMLRNPSSGDATKKLAATIHRVMPDLLMRGSYDTVNRILQIVSEGRKAPQTARFFNQFSAYLHKGMMVQQVIAHLVADLGLQDREERTKLVPIFAFLGDQLVPTLLKVYDNADDKSVRLTVFDIIRALGTKAMAPFMARLKMVESDWAIVRYALSEVAETGEKALAGSCAEFLDYPNSHVRHAALSALLKLCGGSAESYFVQALTDEDVEVRQVAISCLSAINSHNADALAFYVRALSCEDPDEEPEADGVLIECCRALGSLMGGKEHTELAEQALLAAVRPTKAKGMLGKLKKSAPRYGENVAQAALEALADVGSLNAVQDIQELAAADESLASVAAATIERIRQRAARPD